MNPYHMRSLATLLLLLCCAHLLAQTTDVTVTVLDEQLRPLTGATVEMVETRSGERLSRTSDGKGASQFTLSEGQSWMLYINGHPYKQHLAEVVPEGISTNTFKVVHNVALRTRLGQQIYKRDHLQLQPQQVSERDQPRAGQSKTSIRVVNSSGLPQKGKLVVMANLKGGVRYAAHSNEQGVAHFLLPNRSNYDVDVEEVMNITHIDLDHRDQGIIQTAVQYNEPAYREEERHDTITQKIPPGVTYFGGRALTSVAMLRNDSRSTQNEPVYLQDVQTGKVYRAATNGEGKAFFVLPFDAKYLISFRYQPNVDVINLMEIRGRATADFEFTYTPLPELEYPERFLPTPREIKLFDPSAFASGNPIPIAASRGGLFRSKQYNLPSLLRHNTLLKWQLRLPPTENTRRLPYNIVFLLDKSGSMEADSNFYTLKACLKEALGGFSAEDRVAVIFYDTEKTVAFPFQNLPANRAALHEAIDRIETGGGTSVRSALEYTYQLLAKAASPDRHNLVVMVSDGYDDSEAQELEALGKQYAHHSRAITLGVGSIYNRDFLLSVAEKSGGRHYPVAQAKNFGPVFHALLRELKLPVYEHVTLHLEPPAGLTRVYGPDNKPIAMSNKTISIPLGSAVAGAVLSSSLSFSAPGSVDLEQAPARLSYQLKTPEGDVRSFDTPLENGVLAQAYSEVINEHFVSLVNAQLQEFAALNSTGQLTESRKVINDILKALKAWEGENKAIADNEHYTLLKKVILQYERALFAAEKKR